MSKPVFDDVLRLHGRRNRLSYVLFTLASWTLFLAATFLLVLVGASAGEDLGTFVAILWLTGIIPFAWASVTVTAQRCRDLGWSGGAAFLVLVPYVGFLFSVALFFARGESGPNRYGADPLAADSSDLARCQPRAT